MNLIEESNDAIPLRTTPLHLGPKSRARAIAGFAWDPETLEAYSAVVAADGGDGRLLMIIDGEGPGDHWESHPAGDEVVICLSGSVRVVREVEGTQHEVVLLPGTATINPAGIWHAVHFVVAGSILTITAGAGTEHAPVPPRRGA
jgi:mannose-6-phosphate isomerase-like protein (cupin superfamily)